MIIWGKNFSKRMKNDEFMEVKDKKFIFTLPYKLLLIGFIIYFAFYLGSILFGTRSVEDMLKLYKQEENLKHEIIKSKKENERLQKKLFEYEVLVPEDEN